jgi:hypothetical protein
MLQINATYEYQYNRCVKDTCISTSDSKMISSLVMLPLNCVIYFKLYI